MGLPGMRGGFAIIPASRSSRWCACGEGEVAPQYELQAFMMTQKIVPPMAMGLAAALFAGAAFAHADDSPDLGKGLKPPPSPLLQLDEVRTAASRFLAVRQAEK